MSNAECTEREPGADGRCDALACRPLLARARRRRSLNRRGRDEGGPEPPGLPRPWQVHYEWLVNLEQTIDIGEFQFTGYPLK
jgi:hypothetical protein